MHLVERLTQIYFRYSYSKRCMAIQINAYRKKFKSNFKYLIPCNLYGEFDKFDEIQGHFVGALINKILISKKKWSKINSTIQIYGKYQSSETIYVRKGINVYN